MLLEEHLSNPPGLPDDAHETWSEDQIRAYFFQDALDKAKNSAPAPIHAQEAQATDLGNGASKVVPPEPCPEDFNRSRCVNCVYVCVCVQSADSVSTLGSRLLYTDAGLSTFTFSHDYAVHLHAGGSLHTTNSMHLLVPGTRMH